MSDAAETNNLLEQILAELRAQSELMVKPYDTIVSTAELTVTDSTPVGRDADADAVKTVVLNANPTRNIRVKESDCLVAILSPGQSWTSFGGGTGQIKLNTDPSSGFIASAFVITYKLSA